MSKTSRRGEILIEPYKQLRFGLTFLGLNLLFSSLIILVFGYYMWDMYMAVSEYFKLDHSQSMVSMAKFSKPALIGVALIVLFIFTTLAVSARYTHQIYGPMVSIRRFLDELIEEKKPTPIKLRASDQFQDLADRLNGIAGKFTPQASEDSFRLLSSFLDDLIAGKTPKEMDLPKNDPLFSLSTKLNKLIRK